MLVIMPASLRLRRVKQAERLREVRFTEVGDRFAATLVRCPSVTFHIVRGAWFPSYRELECWCYEAFVCRQLALPDDRCGVE